MSNASKKYQVFISSTYTDLQNERKKVRDAILSIYHFPVGMEMFGAANEEQWEVIKETIDTSDFYVLIIGQRYGSVITEGPDAGISYTEKEFRYAKEQGIPILAFLIDDNVPVKPDDVEREHCPEFKAFKDSVKSARMVDFWKSSDDLAQKVTAALYKQISRTKRPGWIRGDSIDVEKSLKEIVELSKQNRELEEENQKLRKSVIQRKPELNIIISNFGTRERPIANGTEFKELKIKDIEQDGYMNVPKERSIDDVQGIPGISSADITKYNKDLPKKKDIDEYNNAVYTFRMIAENGYHIKCELINDGTAKAMDPSAVIAFPEEFQVYAWDEVKNENPPMKPQMPMDPVILRQSKDQLVTLDILGSIGRFGYDSREYYGDGKYEVKEEPLFASLRDAHPVHPTWGVSVENDVAEIWSNDLMHKSGMVSGDFCVVPLKKGTFTIMVSLMCEEYIEPDEREITITVY